MEERHTCLMETGDALEEDTLHKDFLLLVAAHMEGNILEEGMTLELVEHLDKIPWVVEEPSVKGYYPVFEVPHV